MSSRGWDGDHETEYGLWLGRVAVATRSKRGRGHLTELRDALLALPQKRLIAGDLARDGEVCSVGAWIAARRVKAGEDRAQVLADMEARYESDRDTCDAAEAAGMTFTLAWVLGQQNDEDFSRCTPEERYEKVLAWVEKTLAEPPLGRTAKAEGPR